MASVSSQVPAASIDEQFVLTKCDYFVEVQIWPLLDRLNPSRWLENFEENEKRHAVQLLNTFMFFCEPLVNEMLKAAFQGLSAYVVRRDEPLLNALTSWATFVDSVIITHVTGEVPSPTDSGYAFARKARQVLQIPEERILGPDKVLEILLLGVPRPIVFVDDFVGSGSQFIQTWRRLINVAGRGRTSFERIAPLIRGAKFFYCPLICTEIGYQRIRDMCPEVVLHPAHMLSSRSSALDADSIIWPENLKPTAVEFLRKASSRGGIPDTNGGVNDWRGFNKLGLALAIGDSVPDATMPIFYWEKNGWKPLIRRR